MRMSICEILLDGSSRFNAAWKREESVESGKGRSELSLQKYLNGATSGIQLPEIDYVSSSRCVVIGFKPGLHTELFVLGDEEYYVSCPIWSLWTLDRNK